LFVEVAKVSHPRVSTGKIHHGHMADR